MTHAAKATTAALAVALLAAALGGCGDDGEKKPPPSPTTTAPRTPAGTATVALRSTELGQILVDGRGRTLYLFEADTSDKSTCYGACATAWPPVITSGAPTAGPGVKAGLLGTTTRDDGRTEVTYKGHPLYYYVGDTKPGDTSGQGIDSYGATWFVLSAAGDKVEGEGGGY